MTTKKCDYCENEFQAKRTDAKFCSTTCKARAWDQKKGTVEAAPIQSALRGVVSGDQSLNQPKEQTQMIPVEKLNPEHQNYQQKLHTLIKEQQELKLKLKALENKWQLAQQNNETLQAFTLMGGGALIADPTLKNPKRLLLGGVIGALTYELLVKPTPDQRAQMVQDELKKIAVQKTFLNVQLTTVGKQIAVLKQKIKDTPRTVTLMVEKPVLIKDFGMRSQGLLSVPISPTDVQSPSPATTTMEMTAKAVCSEKIKTSMEVRDMKFKALGFQGQWQDFLGLPALDFAMVIHGLPGQGKSTFSLLFARYLAENFGKVIYITAEEGFSKTMQDKLTLSKAIHHDLHIADLRSMQDIITEVKTNAYNFIFIDSLNKLHIEIEGLRELRKRYLGAALITVSQSTKDGKLRGSLEIVHDCDIAIEVKEGIALTTKNRFQGTPREMAIFEKNI